jgi:hypothetical protein
MSLTFSLAILVREARGSVRLAQRRVAADDYDGKWRRTIAINIGNAQSSNDCWHTLRRLLHNGRLCGNGWNMPLPGRG